MSIPHPLNFMTTPDKFNPILITNYPHIAINSKDFMYIETECPKTSLEYLCEKKNIQPSATVEALENAEPPAIFSKKNLQK